MYVNYLGPVACFFSILNPPQAYLPQAYRWVEVGGWGRVGGGCCSGWGLDGEQHSLFTGMAGNMFLSAYLFDISWVLCSFFLSTASQECRPLSPLLNGCHQLLTALSLFLALYNISSIQWLEVSEKSRLWPASVTQHHILDLCHILLLPGMAMKLPVNFYFFHPWFSHGYPLKSSDWQARALLPGFHPGDIHW